jgi:PAS domain S-box-containing protein
MTGDGVSSDADIQSKEEHAKMKDKLAPAVNMPGDILIVDDITENLRSIEAQLKEHGYKVRCVPEAKTAITVATNQPPELMLLDVMMPEMSGFDVCRKLKAQPETSDFPVIFLTALNETENIVEGFQSGGVGFLSKPVRLEEMLAHVKTHVELFRARKAIQNNKDLLEQRVAERTAELQDANRRLSESQAFTQSLLNASPDIIYIHDLIEKENVYSNEGIVRVFGYSVQEIQAMKEYLIPSLMHPDDLVVYREETLLDYQNAGDGEVLEHNFRMKHRDGSWRWLHAKESIFLRLSDRTPKQVFGILSDITEQRKSNEAHEESRKRYQLVAENVSVGIFHADRDGRIEYVNPKIAEITGQPAEMAMGHGWVSFLHPDDRDRIKNDWMTFIKRKAPYVSAAFRFMRPNGEIRWIEDQNVTMYGSDGEISGYIGALTDITERYRAAESEKKHQQQLFQASKMVSLGTLISGFTHEINNPNSYISLNAQGLGDYWDEVEAIIDEAFEPGEHLMLKSIPWGEAKKTLREMIASIYDGSQRIANLITDLGSFIRGQKGILDQMVDLNEVANAAVRMTNNLIRKSTHHFTFSTADNLPVVKGDPHQLEQVLINLLTNACQALENPEQGIVLSSESFNEGETVLVSVQDQGAGIPEENIPQLSDPFFTTRRATGGMGLGLSISFGIIKEHEGELLYESKLQQGTVARILLPSVRPRKPD